MKTPDLHTETHARCSIRIVSDDSPSNPRENDNLGRMVCWHSRYTLGDEQPSEDASDFLATLARGDATFDKVDTLMDKALSGGSDAACERVRKRWQAAREKALAAQFVMLPLYLYDHSGITMSTGRFSCSWDSGKVGFIFCSLAQARKNWLLKGDEGWETVIPWGEGKTRTLREAAIEVLTGEVKTYDQYLTGEVYAYIVTHKETGKEESCWGFFQEESLDHADSYVLAEARSVAESLDVDAATERNERAYWEARDMVTV